ncbi:MAG: hypothetical protein JW830_01305 [Bacteroidales bacterium]|nr:hypothetical protein [Bacteroidales bacterium]
MLDVKYDVKTLISRIYEYQSNILINHSIIRELLQEGNGNISALHNEIRHLQEKIKESQKELIEGYNYSH